MDLRSASVSWTSSQFSQIFCPCKIDRNGSRSNRNEVFVQTRSFVGFHLSHKACSCKRMVCRLCIVSTSSIGTGNPYYLNTIVRKSVRRSAKALVANCFSDKINYEELASQEPMQMSSNFTSLQEDPMLYTLRTELGVIPHIPSPLINSNIAGMFVFFFFVGIVFENLLTLSKRSRLHLHDPPVIPQLPTGFSLLFEKDLQRKESVEWVNMVLTKLWKVYRTGIESWIIDSLQPVFDDLEKPNYVETVEIKQFSLGEEPFVVRTVERITSRRTNDLQYHIGLRYTGGARFLLGLSLKFGIGPTVLPIGVQDFDIDGEIWVKLRLMPSEPWVRVVSWAFVSLPKIKFELSIFRLFNLMTIPVPSMFMRKFLTEDLPQHFVLPNKVVVDFQEGKAGFPVPIDFENGEIEEVDKDFVGELSVTLIDARQLAYVFYGKTDPYVVLRLGDQVIHSKKNTQTSVIGPPGEPIWNQDFHMLVVNPRKQKLIIQVKDSLGFTDLVIGTGEIDLGSLQDTVPTDRIVVLQGGWGLFKKGSSGEILLRLTYKACCEDEEDDGAKVDLMDNDLCDELSHDEPKATYEQRQRVFKYNGSIIDELAALLVSEGFQGGIMASDTISAKLFKVASNLKSALPAPRSRISSSNSGSEASDSSRGSALFWFGIITLIVVLIAINAGGSNFFNP